MVPCSGVAPTRGLDLDPIWIGAGSGEISFTGGGSRKSVVVPYKAGGAVVNSLGLG